MESIPVHFTRRDTLSDSTEDIWNTGEIRYVKSDNPEGRFFGALKLEEVHVSSSLSTANDNCHLLLRFETLCMSINYGSTIERGRVSLHKYNFGGDMAVEIPLCFACRVHQHALHFCMQRVTGTYPNSIIVLPSTPT